MPFIHKKILAVLIGLWLTIIGDAAHAGEGYTDRGTGATLVWNGYDDTAANIYQRPAITFDVNLREFRGARVVTRGWTFAPVTRSSKRLPTILWWPWASGKTPLPHG